MKVAVVGSGAWGTALAVRLCKNGHDVTMWTFEKELVDGMVNDRHNPRLPNAVLPELGSPSHHSAIWAVFLPSGESLTGTRSLVCFVHCCITGVWSSAFLRVCSMDK